RALTYYAGSKLYGPLNSEVQAGLRAQLSEADSMSSSLPPEERFLPPYFLGESMRRSGKPKEAIPFLERSVKLAPNYPGAMFSLPRAYRETGDVSKADAATEKHARLGLLIGEVEAYKSRLEQRPDDEDALFKLAESLNELGNARDAAQVYRHLIELGKSPD